MTFYTSAIIYERYAINIIIATSRSVECLQMKGTMSG